MHLVFLLLIPFVTFANERDKAVINFKEYCVCKDGRSLSNGNCRNFCASKDTNGSENLYATFDFKKTKNLKSLYEWCTVPLSYDSTNPSCFFSFKDESGKSIKVNDVIAKDNSIETRIDYILSSSAYVMELHSRAAETKSDPYLFLRNDR